jgi:hypothetical protein
MVTKPRTPRRALAVARLIAAQGRGRWSCDVPDSSGSGGATFVVTATSENCWRAQRTRNFGEAAPPEASGCVN